jgi:enoyl-CoA hydratase/carnithine racemase
MVSSGKEVVLYEKKEKVAYITLNRPEKLNAINREMAERLREIWLDFKDDENLFVAVLSGSGASFCAGADVKDLGEVERGKYKMSRSITLGEKVIGPNAYSVRKPIVGALKGKVLGAGLWLALECDIRVASDDVVLGLPEPMIGIPTIFAGFLNRHMPQAIANELLLTGGNISAQRAYGVGIVNRVVPVDQLLYEATTTAAALSNNAPLALRAMKQLVHQSWDMDFNSTVALTESVVVPVNNSEDAEEGKKAFLEKRRPRWKAK